MQPFALVVLFAMLCAAQQLPTHPFGRFFDLISDGDQNGVSLARFAQYLYNMDDEGGKPPVERVRPVFEFYDRNRDGFITREEFTASASSVAALSDAEGDMPQEIHLSLTADTTQMLAMWSQVALLSNAQVQWGTSSGSYQWSAAAVSHNYTVDSWVGPWTSMNIYEGVMTSLTPSTQYFYRVGSATNGWSQEFAFTSSPSMQSPPEQVSWAVYGDMGTIVPLGYFVTQMMINESLTNPLDIVLHVGDIAYAGVANGKDGEYMPTWEAYMNQIQPLAARLPYQTTVGNHESYYNYSSFINRFHMNGDQVKGWGNFWFSFDFGSVHVTSFSTEHDYDVGSPQYEFIDADMTAAVARGAKWLIVAGHRPLYSSDTSEYNTHSPGCQLLVNLEPLFAKHQVDFVVTGHMHMYERTNVVYNGTAFSTPTQNSFVNPPHPIYVVQGTAGAMILETLVDPQPAWSAVRLQNYGWGRMDVFTYANGTSAMHYQFKTENSVVLDEIWIYKN